MIDSQPARPLSVLLVEDDEDLAFTMNRWLSRSGYSVSMAGDAVQATIQTRRHSPDVILLDLLIPGASGLDLLTRICRMSPQSAVVVVTAAEREGLQREVLSRGATAFLPKPINRERLEGLLEAAQSHGHFPREPAPEAQTSLSRRLREAFENGEMYLKYQPIYALPGGALAGIEALSRWQGDEVGEVPPSRFIPLAQETGFIGELDAWVARSASRELATLAPPGKERIWVAINVSPRGGLMADLPESIERAVTEGGIRAEDMVVELNEACLLDAAAPAERMLRRLKEVGVRLAFDDFGAGYSGLGYLRKLPFDILKLDRPLVRDVVLSADTARLVKAVIDVAHGMGLELVGEGVETRDQLSFLIDHGCDFAQGYLLSHPQLLEDLDPRGVHGRFDVAGVGQPGGSVAAAGQP